MHSIGTFQTCVFEICLSLLSPLPYLDYITFYDSVEDYRIVVEYCINDLLLCISFYRIIFFARFVLVISKFTNPRAQRICQMNGCEAKLIFAIRSVIREYPYQAILVALVSSILCLAYQIRIFEQPLSDVSAQNFNSYGNAVWLVIITICTVGYGEFYPKSEIGRICAIVACFWGVFVVSLFVVTLNNLLLFSQAEENSYNLLRRLEYRERIKDHAQYTVSAALHQKYLRLKKPQKVNEIQQAHYNYKIKLRDFQQIVWESKKLIEPETEIEVVQKIVEAMSDQIQGLQEKQGSLESKVDRVLELLERQRTEPSFMTLRATSEKLDRVQETASSQESGSEQNLKQL
ncbi:hypothetical protein FGO68_gene10728 [Halteria grandinella]|uniref:Potassium channel domain-containing protein n=1 Tax=Halteria grandinella TaxID=5974 RepID=A0A8J8NU92_HALGN|nr:hypothetical protein FGO68_gene10728 [Halteria grandinella]